MALVTFEPETLVQTLSWRTDILKSYSGLEQRVAVLSAPRERYEIDYLVVDEDGEILEEDLRELRRDLFIDPVTAWTLPLRHEAVPSVNDISGTTVTIDATYVDWAATTQIVYVEGPLGDYYIATIDAIGGSVGARTLTLSASPPAGTFTAGRTYVMPLLSVLLDDPQASARYQVNAGKWRLTGLASTFGTTFGTGATLTTFDSLTLLDQNPVLPGLAEEQFRAGSFRHDYGAIATQETGQEVVDIARQHTFIGEGAAGRQYWKKFLSTVRGRQKPFLLPTWRDDLISETGTGSGTTSLVVKAPPDDAVNYEDYFASLAHRWLQIQYVVGSIIYRKVTNAVDNLDGTLTITVTSAVTAGDIARISFLEQCRLVEDDVQLVYASDHVEVQIRALVVQR